ncbi:membrane protein YqaA with SNARE-associated domain [Loktanella ponticola]|uniref:Membrane protein YqaA with SNARE-associated domain n=1 Tax=Yoonia ponticola TaxID=1524255 RepID=A0A7W9BLU5_9RHOB|nr:UDP-N-acetylmuramate--alanine ligase [Yoonia ponticola]MBB5722810.1 membrane protein YqaA with SNARE-associated domain [Yoonia ponticola]
MANFLVLVVMSAAGLIPCITAAVWMKAGKVGWTLTLFAILGACLALSVQASTRLMGVDPIKAIAAASLVFLPATIGCAVGALLGWMIERQRVKKFQGK